MAQLKLAAEEMREGWAATVAAVPVGAEITGEVIVRRRFGVFPRVSGLPDAVVLAEISAKSKGMYLPATGAFVCAEVLRNAAHNCQVKVRLEECLAADE